MIDNAICEFNKYISDYDLNNSDIKRKYDHVFRVQSCAKVIIESITDDEKLINTVLLAAILHDIGRFPQFRDYNTYMDYKSFDHGDRGKEILENNNYISTYVDDKYLQDVIIHAVKYHNKKDIPITGDEFKDTVLKVVRDADQIDILFEQNNELIDKNYKLNEKMVDSLLKGELCDNNDYQNRDDSILIYLAFIFAINYKKSYEIILNKGIIEHKLNLLKDDRIDLIKDKIYKHINNKLGDDIKC